MVVLRLAAGLAAGMMQYAAAYALARELNTELILDISLCVEHSFGYLLDAFNIQADKKVYYTTQNVEKLFDCDDIESIPEEIRQKLDIYFHKESGKYPVYAGLFQTQISGFSEKKNICLCGYFLDKSKYYDKYWRSIQQQFTLKTTNPEIEIFKKLISGKVSVGVHIRRGDMITVGWSTVMKDEYYRAAVMFYKLKFPKCIFLVFSDDIAYAKKILGKDSSLYYIDFLGYDDVAITELMCLSLCDHYVMSNSSGFARMAFALHDNESGTYTIQGGRIENREYYFRKVGRIFSIGNKKNVSPQITLNEKEIAFYSRRYHTNQKDNIFDYEDKIKTIMETPVTRQTCKSLLKKIGVVSLNVYNRRSKSKLLYKKFLALVEAGETGNALQCSIRLYPEYKKDGYFKEKLIQVLWSIGRQEEALVEMVSLPYGIGKKLRNKYLCSDMNKRLFEKLASFPLKHFILVPLASMDISAQTVEFAALGLILQHMGHKVTIVSEPANEPERKWSQTGRELVNRQGVPTGITRYWKSSVEETGIEAFYKEQTDKELIIISRDERFFADRKYIQEKEMIYIFYDFTDVRCGEKALTDKYPNNIPKLYEKADLVLTKAEAIANGKQEIVKWTDHADPGICNMLSEPWGLEMEGRLNVRQIYAAAAILDGLRKMRKDIG